MFLKALTKGLSILSLTCLSLLFTGISVAEPTTFLGEHGAWKAFSHKDGTTCFMVAEPEEQKGTFTKRGRPHILITHTPKKKTFDTISIIAGYTYKPKSEVKVRLGKKSDEKSGEKTFTLFTQDDTAWARDETTDKAMVKAAISGDHIQVKGTSTRDTVITDIYSLEGFAATHRLIDQACKKPTTHKSQNHG